MMTGSQRGGLRKRVFSSIVLRCYHCFSKYASLFSSPVLSAQSDGLFRLAEFFVSSLFQFLREFWSATLHDFPVHHYMHNVRRNILKNPCVVGDENERGAGAGVRAG